MAQAPIGAFVYDTSLPHIQQRTAVGHGTNTLVAGMFVKISGGTLVQNATSDSTTWGFLLDNSHAATDEPYTSPNGITNNAVDVLNTRFVVNVASGTPTLGTSYGITVTSNVPYINTGDTSTLFVKPHSLYPGDATSDTNARYICDVVATRL